MIKFLNPRYWFNKSAPAADAAWSESQNRMRYNALFALDPDVLVRHLAAFAAGDITGLERIIEEFETREDKMRIGAFKMSAAIAAKPWEVKIIKGEENNERAKLHREVLTRFWNNIEVTDQFCRNRKGGIRLLIKQMMTAQSRVYAVHDIVWHPTASGELTATFTFMPAWSFENRTGRLRYLRDIGAYTGEEMRDGEWLVTVGEGVGVTATILAMAKRLSWNDWLLFSEKCGMPVVLGNTDAKEGTPAWDSLLSAIAQVAPKTGLLADTNTKLQAIAMGGSSSQSTYHELISTVDRAISALYRGGDLSTISSESGQGTGSHAQDGESEVMDRDSCALISETLHREIDHLVIRYSCGDFEPLASIIIDPPVEKDELEREIKIDDHLGAFGIKLSKADMLRRFGRVEASNASDAVEPRQQQMPGGLNAFANELKTNLTRGSEASEPHSNAVLKAFAQDMGPASEEVAKLLQNPTPEAAAVLLDKLPALLPDDPALATVIAEAMAEEFGVTLANSADECRAADPAHCRVHGIREHRDKGFQDQFGNGNADTLATNPKMNAERGKSVITHILGKKDGYEPHAMYRKDVGWIGVDYGTPGVGNDFADGHGISHIVAKHHGAIDSIVDILQNGTAYKHDESKRKIYLIKDRTAVVLSKSRDNRLLITNFEKLSDKQLNEYTSKGVYHAKGEN